MHRFVDCMYFALGRKRVTFVCIQTLYGWICFYLEMLVYTILQTGRFPPKTDAPRPGQARPGQA